MRVGNLSLVLLLVFGAWLLWPTSEELHQEVEGGSSGVPRDVKYVIRVSPGSYYMPGTRPMDLGEPLKGLTLVKRDFERLFPDTRIEYTDVPGSREWLVTQLAAEQAPDILNTNVEDVWVDVHKGWYVPLDPWLEKPNPFVDEGAPGSSQWWDMFKYQAISRGKAAPDGKVYNITLDMIETGIFYNKKVFENLRLAPPKDWADFDRIQSRCREAGYIPLLVSNTTMADWGTDLIFDQFYDQLLDGIDLYQDPKREAYLDGYLDWSEICYLSRRGFFTKADSRFWEVYRILKEWRRHFPRSVAGIDLVREFVTEKGAMLWDSSFQVNRFTRDPDLPFEYGIFYLPAITSETSRYADGHPMCVIGGAATQLTLSNSSFNDTHDIRTSEKLKRCIAFLQYLTLPENTERVVNEMVALLPNVVGVEPLEPLKPFDRILKRKYTTTKWYYTFDQRFNEVYSRTLQLYLEGGMSDPEFQDWWVKNLRSTVESTIRRKQIDLSKFDERWLEMAAARSRMEDLPVAARP